MPPMNAGRGWRLKKGGGYCVEFYSEVETIESTLQFLILDAELLSVEGNGFLNSYDVKRLVNVRLIADYIRDLERRNTMLRKMNGK